VSWVQAGTNEPGRSEGVAFALPPGVSLTPMPEQSLNDLLLAGEIDALIAFEAAKQRSLARALDANAPRFPVPWGPATAQRAQELIGEDFWPYGLEPNRSTLETFLQLAFEQGVCARRLTAQELFVPEVQQAYRV